MEVRFDEEQFVVIDIGSGTIKAGFSGQDLPLVVMPTVMGEKEIEVEAGIGQQNQNDKKPTEPLRTFGNDALARRSEMDQLYHPVKRGIIEDYDKLEKIMEHVFREQLGVEPKNCNVLLTDCPLSTKEHKMNIADIMFRKLCVKSLALQNTAVLSLFSTGTTTGLVAECGEGVTYTVPVFEGYALPHAMHNINVAGGDVTRKLIEELQDCSAPVRDEHYQFVQDIKENMCYVS